MGMTLAEKILAKKSGSSKAVPGQIVNAKVDIAMSHENADVVRRSFEQLGVDRVWDKEKIVIIFDHRVPAESEKTAITHQTIRNLVKKLGIKNFYDVNIGICHQVLPEKGHVRPGELIVGTDSHTTTHGAFGSFATGIGATEMAVVWATGELWLKVPETIKIEVRGRFKKWVFAKDLILHCMGTLKADGADYKSVEFDGETISGMSIASRMVLSNLSMEMGAKAAFVYPDDKTIQYVKARTNIPFEAILPDKDANYEKILKIDASQLEPLAACPHAVDNVKTVKELKGTKLNQALIGSCTNGRLEDLEAAAKVLKGRKIHKDMRLIVIPASWEVYLSALDQGFIKTFVEAGAVLVNSGCGPCLGVHQGILAPGERCISSTNRNFKGRMGSPEAEVYLASPATVAASAIAGEIISPEEYFK